MPQNFMVISPKFYVLQSLFDMKKLTDPHNTKLINPKIKHDGITSNVAFSLCIITIFIV